MSAAQTKYDPKKDKVYYDYTPTAAPTIKPLPTNPTYDNSTWDESTKGSASLEAYGTAKEAVNGYGPFTFSEDEWLANVKKGINEYGDFSYDLNGDALYQQYKDKYIQQGKLAMGDAIGQASAMTGGYGNSYAQSVGQQAYQAQLNNLNDIVPQLYQMALDRYKMGKQDLYSQYDMLLSEYEREYGLYSDEYNKLLDQLGIARDDYYSGADMFYTEQNNKNNVLGREFDDEMSIWNAETENAWKEADWIESANRYANEDAMEKERLAITKEQWEYQKPLLESEAAAANDSSKSYNGTTSNGKNYNNGSLSNGQIKELQAKLGVTADGYWGDGSKQAAGGLTAENAYEKYIGSLNDDPAGPTAIPDNVRAKAASFTNNKSLEAYLESCEASGLITHEQALQLMSEYMDDNEVYTADDKGNETISYKGMIESTNGWSVVSTGGGNFVGIDANAIVMAPNGEKIRLDQLRDKLKAEGMTHNEATKAIKNLQQNLEISSNWFFGL